MATKTTKDESLSEALTIAEVPDGMRVLLIEDNTGEIRITIPETWKVTLGALQPGMDHTPILRIYEGNEKCQRAMFRNVLCFRDLSIPLSRSRIDGENVVWESDPEGNFRLTPRGNVPPNVDRY